MVVLSIYKSEKTAYNSSKETSNLFEWRDPMMKRRNLSLLVGLVCAFACALALTLAASAAEPIYIMTANNNAPTVIGTWSHWASHSEQTEYDSVTNMYYFRMQPENSNSAHQLVQGNLDIYLPASVGSDSDYTYMKIIARTNIDGCKPPKIVPFLVYETEGGTSANPQIGYDSTTSLKGDGTWQTLYIKIALTGYEFKRFFFAPIGALRGNTIPDLDTKYLDIAAYGFFRNYEDAHEYDLMADCMGEVVVPPDQVGFDNTEASAEAGYIAETFGAAEKSYAVIASFKINNYNTSAITSFGAYFYNANNAKVNIVSSNSTALGNTDGRFYVVIYGIKSPDASIAVKPFVVSGGSTYSGDTLDIVPSAVGAYTYYGPELAVVDYFS